MVVFLRLYLAVLGAVESALKFRTGIAIGTSSSIRNAFRSRLDRTSATVHAGTDVTPVRCGVVRAVGISPPIKATFGLGLLAY